jgi:DNA processing protein
MEEEKRYRVGFNLVKGIGAVRLQGLIAYFGDAATAWRAGEADLLAAGLGPKLVARFMQVRQGLDLERLWANIQSQGIRVLTWGDPDYPPKLKEIDQAPPVLYLRGDLLPEDAWAVALVGTRQVTAYGRQVTEEIAAYLAANGVTVVSGLARGVDAVAHQSALKAGGRTLAVLGSGVDRIYPPEHRGLADQVKGRGALVSDYPPGTPPDSTNFPPRNRIISGLSLAVVVVEAGETSGALISAQFAAEQGREVFAVPGSILAPQSRGSNRLLRDSARPLLAAGEILDALNLSRSDQRTARRKAPAEPAEAELLALLGTDTLHVDEIRARAGWPVERVTAALVVMELKGLVRQAGGMLYSAVRESDLLYNVGTSHKGMPTSNEPT